MVDVNYQNWNIFGTLPSRNFNFNMMPGNENILNTPFFKFGAYGGYYCLLSDMGALITAKDPDTPVEHMEV